MYPRNTAIEAAKVTATTAIRSVFDTPRMLPNRAASKLRVKDPLRLISATPRAKLEVVTMPMAASAPMVRRRVIRLISSAETKPQTLAPRKKLTDIR